MERVWIGIGSNLSNPKKQVDCAIKALSQLPLTKLVSNSSYYRSSPLDSLIQKNQPDFLNVVTVLDTNLDPRLLLLYIRKIEQWHGRIRNRTNRWESRTLDLDILLFGKYIIRTTELIIPHYDMKNREFVMYPLIELDSDLILPDGKRIREVIKDLPRRKLNFWKS